jgi:GR25 family glycosyltransferase involved in LPS biosynthesis
MKFTHKVFHIEGNDNRSSLVKSINDYLYSYSKVLHTPTIKISNQEDYEIFIKDNPSFVPDKNGYSLHGEQGWRYGEIGIWASNWKAWHNFLKSDADYLILMEDDIVSSDGFMDILINYIGQLPENWDVFHAFSPADQFGKHTERNNFGADDVCIAYQDWSCLCYVINRAAAQKMIDNSYNFSLPLDWYMFRQQHIFNVYTVKPSSEFPCTLFPTESTFQKTQKREILNGIL